MGYIYPIIIGLLMYFFISWIVKEPGRSLQRKFVSLGNLVGKNKNEITSVAGLPNSISAASNGKTICQWMATGYHIALLFNGDICEGVTYEYRA